MNTDVSIILNIHNEIKYIARTIASLEDSCDFAQRQGLTIEIVVVMDSSPDLLKAWIANYDFRRFNKCKIISVDNRSLGKSRNNGIDISSGEYITTADADDLVSFNFIWECYVLARKNGARSVVLAEYVYSFGSRSYFQKYMGSADIPCILSAGGHPYVSRIFCHRSLFDQIRYVDARGGIRAFEDYHLNCEAIANGYTFYCASNTVLFYRQRAASIMTSAAGKIIPPTSYFEPKVFTRICAEEYQKYKESSYLYVEQQSQRRQRITGSHVLEEIFYAANQIDPMIDVAPLKYVDMGANTQIPLSTGLSYYEACQIVGSNKFTDVVLLPFASTGGGEKYIFQILSAIKTISKDSKTLIIYGEKDKSWESFPISLEDSIVIDLHEICSRRNVGDLNQVTLRLIQATAESARIHVKSSSFAYNFLDWGISELSQNKLVLYYFSDTCYRSDKGRRFTHGVNFNFISDHIENFDLIVSDNSNILEKTGSCLGINEEKMKTIYACCEVNVMKTKARVDRKLTKKLLWASRLDAQKRPDRLRRIADEVRFLDADIKFYVYGTSVFGECGDEIFDGSQNIKYCGPFSRFHDLTSEEFDAFVYTSDFDGLPNVLLEAVSESLLVIAPGIDGVPELIDNSTGVLIDCSGNESSIIEGYVHAIQRIYTEEMSPVSLVENAMRRLRSQHSRSALISSVRSAFLLS
ncbi:glycosyltransferase [Candidimonas nitroreducens]|uniref:Glycosyltransferase 2-like domain-containing protein n=1 Tax=Candidimonas nitroreducens TaxID=683354 RepID=A0A225MR58_9BURK|nr:glycosyltransferase [Candidimonas nitroreducens]OWT63857.1 hypothetical protein CEY11_05995 [Candidimonas nitroreducens]